MSRLAKGILRDSANYRRFRCAHNASCAITKHNKTYLGSYNKTTYRNNTQLKKVHTA